MSQIDFIEFENSTKASCRLCGSILEEPNSWRIDCDICGNGATICGSCCKHKKECPLCLERGLTSRLRVMNYEIEKMSGIDNFQFRISYLCGQGHHICKYEKPIL